MRSTKKEPSLGTGRLSMQINQRRLLPEHLLYDISDDRKLELFVLVCLVHAIDEDDEEAEEHHREEKYHQEPDGEMQQCGEHAEDHGDDPERRPNDEKGNAQRNRLRTVKPYKGALIDQKKNQTGDPSE